MGDNEYKCPLETVDKRLEDAHRLWHHAQDQYFDPEEFRRSVQNLIQTLRTVTFILQKNKSIIPDFDNWYERWQSKMKADPLMRWMVEARNKIEKQGDLESKSFVRAEVIASYLDDECPYMEIPSELFSGIQAIIKSIPKTILTDYVRKHGALRIQRRWVENSLPKYELLEAMAIAYGKISELVHDAHKQLGLTQKITIECETGKIFALSDMSYRMPCMIGHEDIQSLIISLDDGKELFLKKEALNTSPIDREELMTRYEFDPAKIMGRDYSTTEELAGAYFDMIKRVFTRDGHHRALMFYLKGTHLVDMTFVEFGSSQEKYIMMRALSQEAIKLGADGAILVSEAWTANPSALKRDQRPSELATRGEALTLTLVTKVDDSIQMQADIIREGDKIKLGDTKQHKGGAAFTFAPFYRVWNKIIPDKWLKLEEQLCSEALNKDSPR